MRSYNQIVRSVYGEGRTAFWSGFSGLLGSFSAKKKVVRRPVRPASEALAEDWAYVSRDLQRAFQRTGSR